jgi:cell division septation protein DedD
MESVEGQLPSNVEAEAVEVASGPSMGTVVKLGVLAGMCFGLGFCFAKLSTPNAPPAPKSAAIDLDTLKQKQAEYEKIQQRLKLSYYKELSAEPRRSSFVPPAAEHAAAVVAKPGPAAAAPPPAQVAEQKEEPMPEPKAPKVEESKPSSDRMAKALEKVLGKETPDSVASAAKTKLPTQTGSAFAVQVASLPDRKVAEELTNRLKLKGYAARLVQADIPGRGVVYRVRIHGYANRADADVARAKIAKAEKLDAITVAQ